MDSYQQRKRCLEETNGELIQVKWFNDEILKNNNNEHDVKQIADITYQEGLRLAYETNYGLHQHYNLSQARRFFCSSRSHRCFKTVVC